ncbi:MAG: diacylglycerol kinase family lipid kinase [Oscillospiraceae bacterium]|jgi:YegS/Rv2252/BmrU family lipid kinase|nr:diacylglycerol kinase family lipid kinase [Oscillospiraceae bacterium]
MTSFFDGKRALVVINPTAGKHTAQPHLFNLTTLFNISGLETTVFTTRGRGDATEIVRRRGEDFDIVVCRGGDGTFNETINGAMFLQKKPLIGYIPAGSTNDLARTLRIPKDNREAIEIILNGQALWNDLGTLNGGTYFAYTASFGAFTECSYDTPQKLKNRLGHMAYLIQAARSARDIHPIHARVQTAEGYETEGDFVFGAVSNSTSLAGMVKLNRKDVGLNDGLFELLLVRYPQNAGAWGSRIGEILLRSYSGEELMLLHTRHVEFQFTDMIPWTLDGEYGGTHDAVVVENIHNAVRIFRR